MLLYFSRTGRLLESLRYGPSARVGTNVWTIFAYFEGIDLENFSSANIKFARPDYDGTEYPDLFMNSNSMVFNSNIQESNYFENGKRYQGFLFDFSSVRDVDNNDIVTLLDTPGMWEATITLINNKGKRIVVGLAKFNVEDSVSAVDDDSTELSYSTIIHSLSVIFATKLNKNSTRYMRLHSDFVTAAEEGTLFSEEFFEGIVVYDVATESFYKIISTTVSQGDYVYAGYEKIIDLSEVVTDDEFAEKIDELKEELIEYIDEHQHELTMLDFVNTISLASEDLNNVKVNGGVVLYDGVENEDLISEYNAQVIEYNQSNPQAPTLSSYISGNAPTLTNSNHSIEAPSLD